ncbi:ABC transporter ATP-binding protein [Paeniglutamicibacter terrestris]|uniref:ABC transporter ATP-binding protein n=1 Tax=Paeniglutamicibacter terrestris TaxID=2723403 RepID=A0ABX1G053_9MICC|nr:ABC transporter ATP-binding protein [Paeniglutamicibacter terrestris]ASN38374.1 multidrug ABC transporter ATP-binding protein [Arthrobacter sp. 7749]NKG19388.1 ABC transporter ATP-binding protein [Paeniglutamicibacter terrestris]
MDDSSAAVAIAGLQVKRGKALVLPHLDLQVPRGEVVGLLGPSGCGKSTLMRSIVGTQIISAGEITVLGEPAGSVGLRHRVGYMTQEASIYDDITVKTNLSYFAKILGASPSQVPDIIERTDLGSVADSMARDLSGGQRSRLSLGIALLRNPELLVLDEPTVGLDPVLRVSLWELFTDLAAGGVTLLVSSHVMDEATRCGRLILMREGRIIASDTPADLLERTGTSTAENAFLALIQGTDEAKLPPAGKHRATGATA